MNSKCCIEDHRVSLKTGVRLAKKSTRIKPLYQSKAHYREMLAEYQAEINHLQSILFAHSRYAVLIIFQGMDTSGKDSAIKHVMSGVNPQSCQVYSFKQPSQEELQHDFLWRTYKCLPERGKIGIFNRSYYEEVLVARVNPLVLEAQKIPAEFMNPKKIWKERFSDIVNMENYLHRNGTRIVKIFFHLSKEEQKKRLLARIDEPKKNWKLTRADAEARRQWNLFQKAYEDCLSSTNTALAPWYVVPADDKRNARLIVSKIVVDTMKMLRMSYPTAPKNHRRELEAIRRMLEKEK